jgi:hypothetical protein
MKPDVISPLGQVRHEARAVHHVHRGGVVPGGSFLRAANAIIGFSADEFPARRRSREQRHHARRRNDGDGHAPDRGGVEGHSRRGHGAVGHETRLGGDQCFFQLERGHEAVGALCAGPSLANPQRTAGDRRNGDRARDIFSVSDHRHQPDEFQPRHHVALGNGELRIEAALSANSRRGARGNHRRSRAGISCRR